MQQKVTQLPRRDERLCPWCETTYVVPPGHTSRLCPDCRTTLLEEPKEFLVDMLGNVTALNVIIMSALPVPPDILDRFDLQEKSTKRRSTMKEAASRRDQHPE